MKPTFLIPALAVLTLAGTAQARELTDAEVRAFEIQREETSRAEALADAPASGVDSPVSQSGGAEITAGEDSGRMKLRLTFGDFSLTASAPVNKNGPTDLATLDSFGNSTTLRAEYSRALFFHPVSWEILDEACERLGVSDGTCDATYVQQHAPEDYRRLADALRAKPLFWSVWATIGHDEYKFYDPLTLAKDEENRTPWGVGGYLSGQPFDGPTLVTLGAEYQETYKAADTLVVCSGGPPPITCVNGPIGGPIDGNRELVWLEARHRFEWAGVAPRVTYDFDKDVTEVQLPIYLIRAPGSKADRENDTPPPLTGGVRFGWRDDTDDVSVSLFITSSFSIFGR